MDENKVKLISNFVNETTDEEKKMVLKMIFSTNMKLFFDVFLEEKNRLDAQFKDVLNRSKTCADDEKLGLENCGKVEKNDDFDGFLGYVNPEVDSEKGDL